MFGFQVCGYSKSGKTTLITEVITRLSGEGLRVASVKDIHFENFQMDTKGKNTFRHAAAGANPVVARGLKETDFLYRVRMDLPEIMAKLDADWLAVEGYNDFPLPKIVCGKTEKEVDDFLDDRTFAIGGVLGEIRESYRGLRVFNPKKPEDVGGLVRLIKEKVFAVLPYVDDDCCRECGQTCGEMAASIIRGGKRREDCVLRNPTVRLTIGNREIPMVPFVQKILRNIIVGFISELKGWEKHKPVTIELDE